MKLRTMLLGYCVMGVSSLLFLGGTGYWAITRLADNTQSLATASEALRASMRADMMHDALRADAFAVMLAVKKSDVDELKKIAADIEGHRKIFLESMDSVKGLATSKQVIQAFDTTRPKVDGYIASVRSISQQAIVALDSGQVKSKDTQQVDSVGSELPKVLTAFSELETEMALLGDEIEKQNTQTNMDAHSTIAKAKNILLICCMLASALFLSLALVLSRAITKPLNKALKVAEAVASGDLSKDIEADTNNEVGHLLKSLKVMRKNLHNLVAQIKTSAEDISMGAQEISAGNTELSQRTEEQAVNLEQTASSMEELASTVKQNAENAKQASKLATEASAVAVKGGAAVERVVQTMDEINISSKKIEDIVAVIDGIASQTNLLALNATVEAARAGEQGRGFAVVAAEVRILAQRSATAAKEIKQLIGDSVEKVIGGSQLVAHAGNTMNEIVTSVRKVTDIVNGIASASREQSEGIDQVNSAITMIDQMTQQNAAMVEQASAAANSLKSRASGLIDATAKFKLTEASLTK